MDADHTVHPVGTAQENHGNNRQNGRNQHAHRDGDVPRLVSQGWDGTIGIPRMQHIQPNSGKDDVVTESNPNGRITDSDLEMAGLLMLWRVMESICDIPIACHCALFSDNKPMMSWVCQMAANRSLVAKQLLQALALRLRLKRCLH